MNKDPEPDQILNKVIKVIIPEIVNHLEWVFNNFLSLGYYTVHFKESIIIILYKLEGNRDNINPTNYCFIR